MNRHIVKTLAVTAFLVSPALAQTGVELLVKPWPKERRVEAQASLRYFADGNSGNEPFDAQITTFDSSGRFRLLSNLEADPRAGYNLTFINVDSNDPALPDQLTDVSAAAGFGVLSQEGWLGGLVIGLGHASASAFDDDNGYYATATFAAGKTLANGDEIGIGLDYDGNRTIYPDVPLPGFSYRRHLNDQIMLAIGFPFTSIEWKPDDKWRFSLTYNIPDNFEVAVAYEIADQLELFGELRSRAEAFHWDQLPRGDDRVIFNQRYAELGLRYNAGENFSFLLAGGYAFGQNFRFGFDSRDTEELAEISDEMFARAAVELRF